MINIIAVSSPSTYAMSFLAIAFINVIFWVGICFFVIWLISLIIDAMFGGLIKKLVSGRF